MCLFVYICVIRVHVRICVYAYVICWNPCMCIRVFVNVSCTSIWPRTSAFDAYSVLVCGMKNFRLTRVRITSRSYIERIYRGLRTRTTDTQLTRHTACIFFINLSALLGCTRKKVLYCLSLSFFFFFSLAISSLSLSTKFPFLLLSLFFSVLVVHLSRYTRRWRHLI